MKKGGPGGGESPWTKGRINLARSKESRTKIDKAARFGKKFLKRENRREKAT